MAAIDALGDIAPKDKDFPPVLLSAFLGDPEPGVRRQATMALCHSWRNADVLWAPLLERLGGENSGYYGSVAHSLPKLGTPPASAMPALLKALASNNQGADDALCLVLERLGPPARAALPGLLEIARREKPGSSGRNIAAPESFGRFLAAEAIASIDPNSPEARAVVPMIVEQARGLRRTSGWGNTYERASILLARFGPSASAAVPTLVEVMKDESDGYTRVQIGSVLESIKPGGKAALPELAEMARRELPEDTSDRFVTARTVLNIDPSSPEALSLLLPLARVMVETKSDLGTNRSRVDDPLDGPDRSPRAADDPPRDGRPGPRPSPRGKSFDGKDRGHPPISGRIPRPSPYRKR